MDSAIHLSYNRSTGVGRSVARASAGGGLDKALPINIKNVENLGIQIVEKGHF